MAEEPTDTRQQARIWKDLPADEQRRLYDIGNARAFRYADRVYQGWAEFAKYLIATNTGAAAGLFLVLRSHDLRLGYGLAFCLFWCGAFFVGVYYLLFCFAHVGIAEAWPRDFASLARGEVTLDQFDEGHSRVFASRKHKLAPHMLVLSFFCLVAGGIATGVTAFCLQPPGA